jgi:RNA polymerase sigma factor (TIGR02999 family)
VTWTTDQVVAELYNELRRLASAVLREERPDHTLQPTALVHEVWLKFNASPKDLPARDRTHVLALAARAMRQVLVDHARAHARQKRGGAAQKVTLSLVEAVGAPEVDAIALGEALDRLAAIDERQVRIVELRHLAGLTIEETARALELSVATVKRETAMARAWLARELGRGAPE